MPHCWKSRHSSFGKYITGTDQDQKVLMRENALDQEVLTRGRDQEAEGAGLIPDRDPGPTTEGGHDQRAVHSPTPLPATNHLLEADQRVLIETERF